MDFHRYLITVMADDDLEGEFILSDKDAELVRRIIKGLKRMGPYAPTVRIDNLDELAEEAAKRAKEQIERKKAEDERTRKIIEEAMGINKHFPSAMELAFKAAKEKKNGR